MPNLSIIIPALGSNELWEAGLVSVLQHRPTDSEVIVLLNRPYDDPYDLKQEISFLQLPPRTGLVASLREGIAASRAPIVHLVGCGWEVTEDWADHALPAFSNPLVAAVAPVVYQSAESRQLRSAGVTYAAFGRLGLTRQLPKSKRRFETILGPEFQAAFYRREALDQIGGVPSDLGQEAAAVEIALRLRRAGYRAALAVDASMVAADSAAASGSFRRAADAERMFWRHLPSRGALAALLIHPWLVAGEVLLTLPRPATLAKLAGRVWGTTAVVSAGAYKQKLAALAGIAGEPDHEATLPIGRETSPARRHAA